jgi:hypothetical protein
MLATCLAVSLLAGSGLGQPPASEPKPAPSIREFPSKDPQPAKPVKLAEVIKGLGLDEAKMGLNDEPPGKLNSVSWTRVKLAGTVAEVDIEVEIVRTFIIGPNGKYDQNAIRSATVKKVTITPHSTKID